MEAPFLYRLHFSLVRSFLAIRDDLPFEMRGGYVLVVPHDAVFQDGFRDNTVVAYGHIRAYGAVLDEDVVADEAGRYDCYVLVVVLALFYAVLQKPSVRLNKCFGEPAVEPFLYGRRAELGTMFYHHLECVGQLEFSAGADVVVHQVLERFLEFLDVLDVVDAYKGLVTHELLRLFYETFDATFVVGYLNIPTKINRHSGMAKTARPEYRIPL